MNIGTSRTRPANRAGRIAITAIAPLALTLILFGGRAALAQSLTLSPNSANNFVGTSHTVTATITGPVGHCAEFGTCSGGGPSDGDYCKTDNDCDPADTCSPVVDPDVDESPTSCADDATCEAISIGDDFCSFKGIPVGFQVTGTNSVDTKVNDQFTDLFGNVSFNYPDTADVEGQDSITACADLPSSNDADEPTSECIGDNSVDTADVVSNTVTKNWIAAIVGTVTLDPLSAVNSAGPTSKHTVTATVSGVERCSTSHKICSDDTDCNGAGDTCSDKSGVTVGFNINSGPNKGDKGWSQTDSNGQVALTYSDTGGAGLDSIQACLDGDASAPGSPDENKICVGGTDNGNFCAQNSDCDSNVCIQAVSECIADAQNPSAFEPDFVSDPATKRWDPVLKLENLDAGATLASVTGPVYITGAAYNPIGSQHTVRASITGALSICYGGANHRNLCKTDADCSGGDTCGLAGYPVWFSVLAGSQNPGDLNGGAFVNTDTNGQASVTYTDTNGAGIDTIQACVDADVTEGIPDDSTFTGCVADYKSGDPSGQADIPSNTVTKYWLAKFLTGGGKVVNLKAWDTFGGTVGYKPNSTTTLAGEWTQQAHAAKGGNTQCHWNTFGTFALSCSLANCGAEPNTAVFTTSGGGASCGATTVTIVDGQKKPDTISVTKASNPALNWSPSSLVSGNFTIHK